MSHSAIPRTIAHLVTHGLSLIPRTRCTQLLTSAYATHAVRQGVSLRDTPRYVGYPFGPLDTWTMERYTDICDAAFY